MKTRNLLIALLALTMAVTAGCGGASDETDGGGASAASGDSSKASSRSSPTRRRRSSTTSSSRPSTRRPRARASASRRRSAPRATSRRAVEAGQKADVVTFSTEPDMTRLVDAGLVDPTWKDNATEGLVTTSVVSFVVREGNPKNIKTWDDLLKPGVEVLTPNPFSSGAAKWNLLAGYGYAGDGGKDPEAGLAYLRRADHRARRRSRTSRAARRCRTSSAATATCSCPTSTRRSPPTRTARSSSTSSRTTRSRSTSTSRRPRTRREQAKSFVDYVLSEAGPGEVRRVGLPPGQRGGPRGQRGPVPRPARPVHDRRPRRLGEGQRGAVRRRGRLDRRRSRRRRGSRPPDDHRSPHPQAPGRPAGRPRRSASRRSGSA